MSSNRLIIYRPLLLLLSIFPSIMDFSSELALCIRWPKYWSFSISPSNEFPGLISFRIDWFDLLAVQGTLKSLLQHHSSKASVLQCSAFLKVQPRAMNCPLLLNILWCLQILDDFFDHFFIFTGCLVFTFVITLQNCH